MNNPIFGRRALAGFVLAFALAVPVFGSVAFAQDGPTAVPVVQTQPVERTSNGFPWGLFGLLGLGGLAGLNRRPAPVERIETIDASRQR